MRAFLAIALLSLSACKGTPAAQGTTRGSGSGSAVAVSDWANDPPAVIRDKIVGVNAHVIVLKSGAAFAEYRDVLQTIERTPEVVAAEPFTFTEIMIESGTHAPQKIMLKGIDPARARRVLALGANLKSGALDALVTAPTPTVILGDTLATTLAVHIGDLVTVAVIADPLLGTAAGTPTKFQVAGTFHVGFDEYDEHLAYVSLAAAQALMGQGDVVLGIELTVADLEQSARVATAIEQRLGGPPYVVQDWYELNRALFTQLFGNRRP